MNDILDISVFYEVASLLVLATALGIVGLVLRQPLIVGYIAVGVLAGPAVLAVAQSTEHINLLSDLGVALLLFVVGLKLDPHLVRSLGTVALATGLGQIVFTSGFGLLICLSLGMDMLAATYVAVALTFSSTIIIVKLLTDKREIDSLHGRIALGFLIVQDIVVVVALAILSTIGAAGESAPDAVFSPGGRPAAVGLFILSAVLMWVMADRILSRLSRAPELLITFAISWATLMAALGDFAGFGKELGGLAAGVALSSSALRETLASRLGSIRDFLLLFFFIALGSHLEFGTITESAGSGIILSLFVLIGNPLIVMAIMGAMGYRKRTGFLAGLTVAQISEFSLVLMAMGLGLGHVRAEEVSIITLVGLVTIAASTYMIYYSHPLYSFFERFLGWFERGNPWREPFSGDEEEQPSIDAVIFGIGRYGLALARCLHEKGLKVAGVDFDPEMAARFDFEGTDLFFADITDPDLSRHVPLENVKWAVCAVPGSRRGIMIDDPRLVFLGTLRASGFSGRTAVTALSAEDAKHMRAAGATLVLLPFEDAAVRTAERIADAVSVDASAG